MNNSLSDADAFELLTKFATKDFDKVSKEIDQVKTKVGEATQANEKLEKSSKKASGGVAGMGQSMKEAGRFLQDFAQGGIAGVLNNVEGLTMALGGGSGLAGALTILGVAFLTLKPQIEQFLASFAPEQVKPFRSEMERLEDRIKEINDTPIRVPVDTLELQQATKRLDELKKGLLAWEAARTGRTTDEKTAGEQFAKEFEETGGKGKDAIDTITAELLKQKNAQSPLTKQVADQQAKVAQLEALIKKGGSPHVTASFRTDLKAAQKRLEQLVADKGRIQGAGGANEQAARDEVGELIELAKKGNNANARERLRDLFNQSGLKDFASMASRNSPEQVQRDREELEEYDRQEAEFQAGNERARRHRLRRDAAEKKRLAEADRNARDLERDMDPKHLLEAERLGFPGLEGDALAEARRNAREARAAAAKKAAQATARGNPDAVSLDQIQRNQREFDQEQLAKQIYQNSGQATGVQFTPSQARDTAKATMDLVDQGANLNQAVQFALNQQLQAMAQLANQLQQQRAEMMRLGQGFGQVTRFMDSGWPTNLPGGR